ncbi:hypothetical protein [Catenovulum sediminis]|uniref:hypothetical protein n=1 Tax=Catenovulum sediminis TaxID=1740262 RepID=UPI00117F4BA7|nr:hypothetical protein [Catenovulum sediminis]
MTPYTPKYPVENNHVFIVDSEFAFNGHNSGRSHNMYITNTNTFSIFNSYSHDADTGHLIKTIARENYIIGNKLEDGLTGTSSYHIDITGGGPTFIHGNVLVQTQNSPNYVMVAYAAESKEGSRNNPNKHLFMSHNTIVNYHDRGKFLKIYDNMNDFEEGYVANNLVYGLSEANFVTFSKSATSNLVSIQNNIITDGSDFESLENESYYLAKHSVAIDAAIDVEGFELSKFKHQLTEFNRSGPANIRLIDGKLDVGAFEYDGLIHPVPSVELIANQTTIDYLGSVELAWTAQNAHVCDFSGGLDKRVSASGSLHVDELSRNTDFILTCYGDAGKNQSIVSINVNESPKADLLPETTVDTLLNTRISDYLTSNDPYVSGVMKYWPGGTISSVYVPEKNVVYINGGGMRTYFGNELFAFDVTTQTLQQIHQRTDITQLDIFEAGDNNYWDVFNYPCSGIWTTVSGEMTAAPRNLKNSLTFDYKTDSLFFQGGYVACSSNYETSDGWLFAPDTGEWTLLHAENSDFKGTTSRIVTLDKVSGLQIIAHNQGLHVYNAETAESRKLVNSVHTAGVSGIIDEASNTLFYIGNGRVISTSLDGLATAEALSFKTDWQIIGDDYLLNSGSPKLTYHTEAEKIVGWNGQDRLYYLYIDHENSTIEIVAKNTPELNGSRFEYIQALGGYLVIDDSRSNFSLLREVQ